jgi:hypothetical protein
MQSDILVPNYFLNFYIVVKLELAFAYLFFNSLLVDKTSVIMQKLTILIINRACDERQVNPVVAYQLCVL